MNIEKTLLEKVKSKTNLNFQPILSRLESFIENDYQILVDYFTGKKTLNNPSVFHKLDKIILDFNTIHSSLFNYRRTLYNTEYISFMERLEDLKVQMDYLRNLNRWLRSSLSLNSISYNSPQRDYLLGEGDTLERISRGVLRRENFQDNWFDLALSNSLLEEDYTGEGGELLRIPAKQTLGLSYNIESVVDVIVEKSCYGKDIQSRFEFTEEDLLILSYNSTIEQAVEILITLRKGDNLDSPGLGIQEEMFIGSNRTYFNTPTLIRQITESFGTDDTLTDFNVKEVRIEQDNFFLDFQVRTILGELVNLTTQI